MGIFRPKRPTSANGEEEDLESLGFHEEGDDGEADDIDEKAEMGEDGEVAEEEEEEGMDYDEEEDEDVEKNDDGDSVSISKNNIILAKRLLESIRESNDKLMLLLGGLISSDDEARIGVSEAAEGIGNHLDAAANVIEGVFDGQNMIGPDGKEYSIPANYASKSKLVEGDMLKLTITERGTFVYKQTKPVERRRIIGQLEKDEEGNYVVLGDQRKWKVLTASITYFKGNPGDKAVILIPVSGDSQWGAVENVIRNK